MSDYDRLYKDCPGRDDFIKQVREKIDELGIEYLYLPVRFGHRPHYGQGHSGGSLGGHCEKRLSTRLRLNRQPIRQSPRRVPRLRPGGRRAGRRARPGNFHAATVGQARRAHVLHVFRNREEDVKIRGGFLTADCRGNLRRIHQQFTEELRHAHAPWHRAGDDVAEEGRPAAAQRRLLKALLLPHRSVRKSAADLHEGDRIRHGKWAST